MTRKGQSSVWDELVEIRKGGRRIAAWCPYCEKTLSANSKRHGTNHLKRHLKMHRKKHPNRDTTVGQETMPCSREEITASVRSHSENKRQVSQTQEQRSDDDVAAKRARINKEKQLKKPIEDVALVSKMDNLVVDNNEVTPDLPIQLAPQNCNCYVEKSAAGMRRPLQPTGCIYEIRSMVHRKKSANTVFGNAGSAERWEPKTKSKVWEEFTRVIVNDVRTVLCSHCKSHLTAPSSQGTSHLQRHLRFHCRIVVKSVAGTKASRLTVKACHIILHPWDQELRRMTQEDILELPLSPEEGGSQAPAH